MRFRTAYAVWGWVGGLPEKLVMPFTKLHEFPGTGGGGCKRSRSQHIINIRNKRKLAKRARNGIFQNSFKNLAFLRNFYNFGPFVHLFLVLRGKKKKKRSERWKAKPFKKCWGFQGNLVIVILSWFPIFPFLWGIPRNSLGFWVIPSKLRAAPPPPAAAASSSSSSSIITAPTKNKRRKRMMRRRII